jgi:exonuclease III
MRIDHLLLSTLLLDQATAAAQVPWRCRVRRAEIVGYGADRHDFFGSDHCPMLLELQPCTECV